MHSAGNSLVVRPVRSREDRFSDMEPDPSSNRHTTDPPILDGPHVCPAEGFEMLGWDSEGPPPTFSALLHYLV